MNDITNQAKIFKGTSRHSPQNSRKIVSGNYEISTPGPGSYEPNYNTQTSNRYHTFKDRQVHGKKQFEWMFQNTRSRCFFAGKDNNTLTGPGKYQLQHRSRLSNVVSFKSGKFKPPLFPKSQTPGPGTYQEQLKTSTLASQSCFRSKVQRNIFKLKFSIMNRHKEVLAQTQTPSSVNQQAQNNTQIQKSYSFASKVPRFLTEATTLVGPGSYQLSPSSATQRSKEKISKIVKTIQSSYRKPSVDKSQACPGSYNLFKYSMSRKIQFMGSALAKETRFNFKTKKRSLSDIPGPGHYDHSLISSTTKKPMKKRSCTQNSHFKLPKAKTVQGDKDYQLDVFDISYKLQKQREHLRRMKLIKSEKAAFDSSVKRFS